MSISLVAGLGNPGREYELTRHNLGWVAVDAYAAKHGLAWKGAPDFESVVARRDLGPGRTLWFMKPQTFMNGSGRAVATFARYHRIAPEDVAAVYDDLTIDLGLVKVSVSGSDAGHNGVASLLEHLGDGFARLRLGVGPKHPPEMDIKDFVLERFSTEQLNLIQQKTDAYVQGLELLLASGPDRAMNQLNRRDIP
ncbi:MAG TPA: aminoacyl-tRNA hydrolase [Dongiaceae bacterium]|nr:aminoacyl-tRNA hydrolase [Dongiaceae bacterium]